MFQLLYFILSLIFCVSDLQAMLVEINDNSTKNRFLGVEVAQCLSTGKQAYNSGNGETSKILGINFLKPEFFGLQFYAFNDFVTWIGQRYQAESYAQTVLKYSGSQLTKKMEEDFPAPGLYMIVIGTSHYLQQIAAPDKVCPPGQQLVIAQLKYNDGNLIYTWSQDVICLSPNDSFALTISSDIDTAMVSSVENQKNSSGIDWMKNPGPAASYQQAKGCPRSIRLIKKSQPSAVQPTAPSTKK